MTNKLNESHIIILPGVFLSEDSFNFDDYIFAYKNVRHGAKVIQKCSEKSSSRDKTIALITNLCYYILMEDVPLADKLAKHFVGLLESGRFGIIVTKDKISEALRGIALDPAISRKLGEIKSEAAKEIEAKGGASDSMIETKITGKTDHFRIISKDTRYDPPCAAYLVFLRSKGDGTYKMGMEGVPRRKSNYEEPVFESPKQALDFIENAKTKMETKKPLKDFLYTITDDQFRGSIHLENFGSIKDCYELVNTDCGPAYMNKKCGCKESLTKDKAFTRYNFTDALLEADLDASSTKAVAKHTRLNPKLWTADEKLKPEVEEKIKQIVDIFLNGLLEDEIKINVKDILIIGSNASYNYTPHSDLDLHIIVDTDNLQCPDNLYSKLYSAYRSLFNKRLDIDFYNIPVELYIEDESTPRVSNGVYSVLNKEWLQEPQYVNIPDMDMDIFDAELAKWEERYRQVSNDAVRELEEYYTPNPDAAEDIKTKQIKEIEAYIEDLYNLRKVGLPLTGEYGLENVIFKTIRNKGYLDKLKDLKNKLLGKELSLD